MKNEISDFLVELRLEMGNTQNELGQYLGVSNKTVSKWENGVSIPDTFYIPKIAKYYNITCDELLLTSAALKAPILIKTIKIINKLKYLNFFDIFSS